MTENITAQLQDAAAKGTDEVDGQSLLARFESFAKIEDPQQAMRDAAAASLLAAATRAVADGRRALLVDVGSAVGKDAGAWRARAEAAGIGADRLDVVGVELLASLNEKAASAHPTCRFLTGDVAALPLESGTADGVHCSRLLIHSSNPARAVDELVRVLRPGGVGVVEEGDYATNALLSGDERCLSVSRAANEMTISRLANPHAARVAHALLRGRDDVENVTLEAGAFCMVDWEKLDPGLGYLRKTLDALVAAGTVSREDADHYCECLLAAPDVGEPITSGTIFKIAFVKKSL